MKEMAKGYVPRQEKVEAMDVDGEVGVEEKDHTSNVDGILCLNQLEDKDFFLEASSSDTLSLDYLSSEVAQPSENVNPQPHSSKYRKAELAQAYDVQKRDWSHLLDPSRQRDEGLMIEVLKPRLLRIPVSIPINR
ncbi:hypothetical protein F0562_025389 [Nyssa sinensis]|uniref:Uncharacterized protein n=1 Tax=Nyssa sinensis TaxID=561372 RepID=A0A5J5BFL3_9ASTE|nr:hypothetical protein F0562_025389 [Nyssa sinensis]